MFESQNERFTLSDSNTNPNSSRTSNTKGAVNHTISSSSGTNTNRNQGFSKNETHIS